MTQKEHRVEGYAINLETNEEFNPQRIYRGKLQVNCSSNEAMFREQKKRGPRNKVIYDGNYVAVSYSKSKGTYWFRFHNESMQGFKPTLVTSELGLAVLAVNKHRSKNKNK